MQSNQSFPFQSQFSLGDQSIRRHAAYNTMLQPAITVDEIQGRVGRYLILFFQFHPLTVLHIHLYIHKLLIKESSHLRIGKYLFRQHLAGSAPRGITIHENQFVFFPGLFQSLLPGPFEEDNAFRFFQCLLPITDESIGFRITTSRMNQFAVSVQEQESRIATYRIFLRQLFFFPEINFQIDEIPVIKIGHFVQGKHIFSHHDTRLAPSGISINENQFIFFFSFFQCFFQTDFLKDNRTFVVSLHFGLLPGLFPSFQEKFRIFSQQKRTDRTQNITVRHEETIGRIHIHHQFRSKLFPSLRSHIDTDGHHMLFTKFQVGSNLLPYRLFLVFLFPSLRCSGFPHGIHQNNLILFLCQLRSLFPRQVLKYCFLGIPCQ